MRINERISNRGEMAKFEVKDATMTVNDDMLNNGTQKPHTTRAANAERITFLIVISS